jgi:hypothetical protein
MGASGTSRVIERLPIKLRRSHIQLLKKEEMINGETIPTSLWTPKRFDGDEDPVFRAEERG